MLYEKDKRETQQGLVVSNWYKHTQRSLSIGWTTPICSLSRSRQSLPKLSTSLFDGSRLA
ncbi:MAG TPA: hypothetical protein VII61_13335 [Ktedonobacteraceae bacterium]